MRLNQRRFTLKSEIRISKSETNTVKQYQQRKIQNGEFGPSLLEHCSCCVFHFFEFVSDFDIRVFHYVLFTFPQNRPKDADQLCCFPNEIISLLVYYRVIANID